ncbi:PBECR4 domain-containing protein [Lactococcus petauri]|uniref:PBECR4 domain-containing protein n=1 Tax=Lactococcus petauri TaxID=1940789 RepID=UPI00254DE3E1|nr:PBECR4 domain-containing protein [Lactococcus petauri]
MATKTYKKMEELTEKAKSKDIVSVADSLGIKLTRTGQSFKGEWAGHDSFSFNPRKNTFDWYGRGLHGDSIDLVKTIKDVNFKGAVAYLNEIDVESFDKSKLLPKEKFSYYLKDNEDIQELNQYLIDKRGHSEDTVSFFLSEGILSQSTWRTTLDSGEYFYEPVAVFKQLNKEGAIDGASVQGFYKNEKIHKDHKSSHLKRIMPKSDGYGGFALNIGTPKRLIIFEAPIDMMSYYDLHKENLIDVKLVACDGYKPMAYARYIIEILNPTWVYKSTSEGQQDVYDRIQKIEEIIPNIEGLPQNFITFAYDNDAAGNQFIQQFRETYPNIGKLSQSDLPPLEEGQLKSDWNDYLQKNKKEIKNTIMNDNLLKNYYEMSLKDIRKGFDQFMTHTEDIEYRQEMWENLQQNHKKYRTQMIERNLLPGEVYTEGHFIQGEEKSAFDFIDYEDIVPGSYDEETQTLKIGFTANDKVKYNLHHFEAVAKVTIPKQANRKIVLNSKEYFKSIAPETSLPNVMEWKISRKDFEVALNKQKTESTHKEFVNEIHNLEKYASDKGLYLWTRNENWMSDSENDEGEQFLFDEGLYAANAYDFTSIDDLDAWLKAEEVFLVDGLGQTKTFSELKQELLLESQKVKKSPEEPQEKDNFSNKKERINGSMGSLPSENLEGSPAPDAKAPFESTVTSDPTQSSRYLKFTTDRGYVSKVKQGYKIADPKDLNYLNRYAGVIQDTAQWYQEQLADSKVYYLYQDKDEVNILEVDYLKSNFTHLTGVFALDKKQTSEKTLDDLAAGKGHFNNLLVSYGYREKLQVLPLLPEIVESTSFVFNDLSDVPKMGQLNVEKAIQSEDKELLLAFRSADGKNFPASLLKTGKNLKNSLAEAADKKVILGVFQSKNDEIKQLSINTEVVKDRNLSLKDFLESSLQEQEIQKNELPIIENNIEKAENKAKAHSKSLSDILKAKDTHALTAHMKAGVKEYLNSDTYKNYLDAVSKFHRYSSKNIRLLLSQNQNISMVASYKDWNEKFERQVSKGSKSLKVYVPKIQKLKDDEGKVKLDPNGKEMTRTYFQLGSVFDVSQTTGKEIPKPVYQLEGEVKNYSNIYAALTKTTKAEIGFTDISTGAHGFYQPDSDIIRIQKGMKQEQTIKTVIHEIAHSNLHNLEARKKHEYTKEEKELQAESVAYVVSNHLGIDTSSYSFGYLANWSSDINTLDHLEGSMAIIRDEAAKIISRLDQELTQVKTKNVAKDSLEADIEKARLKQQQMEVSSQTKKEQSPIQDNQVQQKEPNKK